MIRLGGNTEDRAVEILQSACAHLGVPIEGYKKTDPPAKIARRFAELVAKSKATPWKPRKPERPRFIDSRAAKSWPIRGGKLWIDSAVVEEKRVGDCRALIRAACATMAASRRRPKT